MKFTEISNNVNEWFNGLGPRCDIVISSRTRLARNLAGYKFLTRCNHKERKDILAKLKKILLELDIGGKVSYESIDQAKELDRDFLVERHLISRNLASGKGPRGVVIARDESFTAMINEEDHLRMQTLSGGLGVRKCYQRINTIDDEIEKKVNYAFSPKYGYLTACPTNLGTGIRVSVMLHLPALKMTGDIKKFFNAAKSMKMAVRGLFGEGSDSAGDFYQLSNQLTLGLSEEEIVSKFEDEIIPEICQYEELARKYLIKEKSELIDDKVSRALALLTNARLMSSQEALFLLSHLRLGLNIHDKLNASTSAIDRLCAIRDKDDEESEYKNLSIKTINRLFMLTLPAHLQMNSGEILDPDDRDALRADIIRKTLSG